MSHPDASGKLVERACGSRDHLVAEHGCRHSEHPAQEVIASHIIRLKRSGPCRVIIGRPSGLGRCGLPATSPPRLPGGLAFGDDLLEAGPVIGGRPLRVGGIENRLRTRARHDRAESATPVRDDRDLNAEQSSEIPYRTTHGFL
ncbi:hypothetical protein [Nocardia harenae]|uniref:hypothetical protein n=1 Tax=Nocardia harenae TaxID=358707 RepID=UPI0012ED1AE2|nr:hypothetical protein [Nocardia harenae]